MLEDPQAQVTVCRARASAMVLMVDGALKLKDSNKME